MRSRALLLAGLVLASPVLADPPLPIHKGEVAPADGVFLPTLAAHETALRCAQAEADRDKYRQQVAEAPLPSGGSVVLVVGAAALLLGVVLGGVAAAAVRK